MKFENFTHPAADTKQDNETSLSTAESGEVLKTEVNKSGFLEQLNKARQGNVEHEDVYRHVFNGKSSGGEAYPDSLVGRPDLLAKFAVGKNGEPYKSTRDASHDLIEFLANEVKNGIRSDEDTERLKKDQEEINNQKNLLEQLNKARQGNVEHEDVYWHVFNGKSANGETYPDSLVGRPDLLAKFAVGKNGEPYKSTRDASHDLIEFLANETEEKLRKLTSRDLDVKNSNKDEVGTEEPLVKETAPEKEETPTEKVVLEQTLEEVHPIEPPPFVNQSPEPPPFFKPETISQQETISLDDSRDSYLKAKRLRGNVFRGGLGSVLNRKIRFGAEDLNFGGKKGMKDLENIRNVYQENLKSYRETQLSEFASSLSKKLNSGEIEEARAEYEIKNKIIDLLNEEQKNVDSKSIEGIEKNIFEKMKTGWRQHTKVRLFTGILLGGAAMTGIGGAAVIGARAGMGAVGTYVGVESGLEKYSKLIGHRGLIDKIDKQSSFITDEGISAYIRNISIEDVKKEASRLRMLQVEKGISMSNKGSRKETIAALILERDNELTSLETLKGVGEATPENFIKKLSSKLVLEINARNEAVESEVDKERLKKMARKTTALLAGGAMGWLIGGKLFEDPKVELPGFPKAPEVPDVPQIPNVPDGHIVISGENVWKIIESDLDSKKIMAGMTEGNRTFVIDALKDKFEAMSPTELNGLGFSSGDLNLIYAGENLNLSSVLDDEHITKALLESRRLTADQITQIIQNNATIAHWLAQHRNELTGLFNSSLIEKILNNKA